MNLTLFFTFRLVSTLPLEAWCQAGRRASSTCSALCFIYLYLQTTGAEAIIDATVTNTPIFVRTSTPSSKLDGSIVINNAKLTNVPTAVGVVGGATVLAGGTTTIASWAQGNIYTGTNPTGRFAQGSITAANKPSALLDSSGRIFGKTHPQYADYAVGQFVSVRDQGAAGDGKTDDTNALTSIFAKVCSFEFPEL